MQLLSGNNSSRSPPSRSNHSKSRLAAIFLKCHTALLLWELSRDSGKTLVFTLPCVMMALAVPLAPRNLESRSAT
jgi:hypothetical protein